MSIIKRLRSLSRQEASMEHMQEFQRQVRLESNDRGATLLVTANCDLALSQAIYRHLKTPEALRRRLEDDNGPLNSFAQKMLMGRAMGIYGEVMHHNLDIRRHMRNAFAHSHVPITFETPLIVEAIADFKVQTMLPPHQLGAADKAYPDQPRERFHHACDTMSHNLIVWGWRKSEPMP